MMDKATRKHVVKAQGDALARLGGYIACLRPAEVEARLPVLLEAVAVALGDLSALVPEEPEAPAEPG